MTKRISILWVALFALIGLSTASAVPTGDKAPLFAKATFTGGGTATAALTGAAGRYTCVTGVKVHMLSPATAVGAAPTLGDGTTTISINLVDTTSAGAYADIPYAPALQATNKGDTWTLSMVAFSGGAAGDIFINGYTSSSPCE